MYFIYGYDQDSMDDDDDDDGFMDLFVILRSYKYSILKLTLIPTVRYAN